MDKGDVNLMDVLREARMEAARRTGADLHHVMAVRSSEQVWDLAAEGYKPFLCMAADEMHTCDRLREHADEMHSCHCGRRWGTG